MSEMKFNVRPFWVNLVSIILFLAGFGVFLTGSPKNADDYLYMDKYRDWFLAHGIEYPENGANLLQTGFPFSQTIDSFVVHYNLDNGRLANMLATVMSLFPKWVGSGVALICLLFSVLGAFRLVGIDFRRSWLVALSLFLWTFLLPWWEHFGALTFQYNYLFPAALSVWLLILLTGGRCGRARVIWAFFLGLVTGCSNEAFSAPLFASIVVLAVFYRKYRNGLTFATLAGLLAGLLYLASSPGIRQRAVDSAGGNGWLSSGLMLAALPALAFSVSVIILSVRKGWRHVWKDSGILLYSLNAWLPLLILLLFKVESRAAWWSTFISVAGVMYCLRNLGGTETADNPILKTVVSIFLTAVMSVHLVSIDVVALYQRRLMRELYSRPYSEERSYRFAEMKTLRELPLCAGINGARFSFIGLLYTDYYFQGAGRGTERPAVVIPRELEFVTEDSGSPVPGGTGIRECAGWLFVSSVSENPTSVVYIDTDFGNGYVPLPYARWRFESAADGKCYDWLMPVRGWYLSHFKTIKAIRTGL